MIQYTPTTLAAKTFAVASNGDIFVATKGVTRLTPTGNVVWSLDFHGFDCNVT